MAVGLIGTGMMGVPMGLRLLASDHDLRIFNRTPAKAAPLLAAGAVWCDAPAAVAAASEAVITLVGGPADVEALYLGPQGLIETTAPGGLLLDMTTSSPVLARRLAAAAAARGLDLLDAPVTGGVGGARDATLSILVGGEAAALERARPLLQALGRTITLQGPAGAGQRAKLVNQTIVATTLLAVAEGLALALEAGHDTKALMAAIEPGTAGGFVLNNHGRKMLAGDFAPGFFVRHLLKDVELALAAGEEEGLRLAGLALVRDRLRRLVEVGQGESGVQALLLAVERTEDA